MKNFFEKLEVNKKTQCWEWTGYKIQNGYGMTSLNSENILTHRLAYKLYNSEIPKNMCVLHKCDNRVCCNPDHLFVGTKTDNNRDRDRKKRTAKGEILAKSKRGEKNPQAKLTNENIKQIKYLLKKKISQIKIANNFKIDPSTISNIYQEKSWKYVY